MNQGPHLQKEYAQNIGTFILSMMLMEKKTLGQNEKQHGMRGEMNPDSDLNLHHNNSLIV